VAPLCDAPVCEGHRLTRGNLASTRDRGRSSVRLIPIIPNLRQLGGLDQLDMAFDSRCAGRFAKVAPLGWIVAVLARPPARCLRPCPEDTIIVTVAHPA
jgi:hypothetical protein